jgi:hypothetical protein
MGSRALHILAEPTSHPFFSGSGHLSLSSPVSIVRIGALFPQVHTVQRDSTLDRSGIARFSAFLLALDEINNSTQILPSATIQYMYRDSQRDALSALKGAVDFEGFELCGGTAAEHTLSNGVNAVIGAASSGPSIAAQEVLRYTTIPQISYSATSPSLSAMALSTLTSCAPRPRTRLNPIRSSTLCSICGASSASPRSPHPMRTARPASLLSSAPPLHIIATATATATSFLASRVT